MSLRNYRCRVARNEEDIEIAENINRQIDWVWMHPVARPNSWPLILHFKGEPVGIARVEHRTEDSRIEVEDFLDWPSTQEPLAQVSSWLDNLAVQGPLAGIGSWGLARRSARFGLPFGPILAACAIKVCLVNGLYRAVYFMRQGSSQNRVLPRLAASERFMTVQRKHLWDIWLTDLHAIRPEAARLLDDVTEQVLEL